MIKSISIIYTPVSPSFIWWKTLLFGLCASIWNKWLIVSVKSLKNNLTSAVSSTNAYTKTFTGIDEAGKRLADEVSLEILYANLLSLQFRSPQSFLSSFMSLFPFMTTGHAGCKEDK